MTTTATENKVVTTAAAIEKLRAGLLAIPDGWDGIGHYSASPAVRKRAAALMVLAARGAAAQLAVISEADAVVLIAEKQNFFANLDPHGLHIGSWAHVATMSSRGREYVTIDGVLGFSL